MTRSAQATMDPSGYPSECFCDAVLSDGAIVRLRPIRPDDAPQLLEFHNRLSGESVHRRFFSAHPHLRPEEVAHFTCVDYEDRLALVAETDGCLVAVGRYDRLPKTDQAEVAFVVADAFHGRGLGTLLLEHLAAAGRRRGVGTFFAETLAYNHPMIELFHQSGFPFTSRTSQGVTDVSFSIAPTQQYLERLMWRHLGALHAWLAPSQLNRAPGAARPVIATDYHQLAYLALDAGTQVIGLVLAGVTQPRRFVSMARAVARRKPVIALIGASPRCPSDVGELGDQAGIETFEDAGLLARRQRQLLADVAGGTWQPIDRGTLLDPQGCDVYRARAVVRRFGEIPATVSPAPTNPRGELLDPAATEELLASYRLTPSPTPLRHTPRGLRVVVEDEDHRGLAVRLVAPGVGSQAPLRRVLPLTDRDAQELVSGAAPECESTMLMDCVARAARLIDDQCEIMGLDFPVVAGEGSPSVWIGPPRSTGDDPFVPRVTDA